MKKVKFSFVNNRRPEISEVFGFDEDETEEVIDEVYKEWFYNELDRAGIEGHYEEID